MADKVLKDVRVNNYRVFFGKINNRYVIAMPDVGISGYTEPFFPVFKQDNTQKLSDLFKTKGLRNITLAYLVIHVITELWRSEEEIIENG